MALSPKLALRQSTQLVMTPQLQQAIKLLQMSNQELSVFVESEIEENPLLEREDTEGGRDQENEAPAPDAPIGDERLGSDMPGEVEDNPPDTAALSVAEHLPDTSDAPLDTDYANDWTNDDRDTNAGAGGGDERAPEQFANWGNGGGEGEGPSLEERLTEEKTLRDHLNFQINVELNDIADRLIATALTDGLDEAGYLRVSVTDVAERLSVDKAKVESVLTQCQTFDPSGVYARDLAECLKLQLIDRNHFDPAMEKLLQNLDLLAKRDVAQLKRLCKVDDEDLTDMVAEIRALNPKPGLAFEADVTQTVVPDILLRPSTDGSWQVELNANTLPRVLVNQTYYTQVRSATHAKKDREYLADRMASANWLVRALHQRATTILKVAAEIVRTQEEFLEKGVQYLKPLTLREVADAIGMHESTVSRVTTSKYMTTPRGLFELKYFFTTAIASNAGGDFHSAEAVRHRIRELTEHETSRTVLSDDKIVTILSEEGINIARRTVAKYREALHIPSSSQRRREKAISL
jgi:RNA polymerase sigma-54 factor